MKGSFLPDVNVLLALTVFDHKLHQAASAWAQEEQPTELVVCRLVQLSFLRLLTTRAVMQKSTLTNRQAWAFHDDIFASGRVRFVQEPIFLLDGLRQQSGLDYPAPKRWNAAYLSAFATSAGLVLVTFDLALASYTPRSILLHP